MSNRMSDDDLVTRLEAWAKEVQDSRRILAAIRALPDVRHHNGYPDSIHYGAGYNAALRQVKALLDGES